MGAVSGELKNSQMNAAGQETAPTIAAKFATIASSTAIKPENSTIGKKIKKIAHGLLTGEILVFTEINGTTTEGATVAGLVIGRPYYVFKIGVNEFAVAFSKAQAEAGEAECIEFTVELKEASTITEHLIEHIGAETKRQKTKFENSKNGISEDVTAHEVEASGAVEVKWLMFFSAETVGTFCGCNKVTAKTLAAKDIYKITKSLLEDTAAA